MLNTFKGLSGDNAIMDLISASYFNSESQHDHDPSHMFIQPSLDVYQSMSDELPPGLLLNHIHQDRTKPQPSPKKDLMIGTQPNAKTSLLGFRNDAEMLGEDKLGEEGNDSDSDNDSSSDAAKKRGKYRTYTDEEKNHIINLMMKHGIQKTLEIFSNGEHKITKRKLKSWLESQGKVKGVKGRKSNDPARDRALHEWCMDFQNEHGRPPSRKEATQKALELSGDPNFQASKGWLDKFSRKYNLEFTPLKIIPPRGKKVKTTTESEPVSAASTQESILVDGLSPIKDLKDKQADPSQKKNKTAFKKDERNPESLLKMNPLFGLNKHMPQQIPPVQAPQQPQQLQPVPSQHQQSQQQHSPQPSQSQQQQSQAHMYPQLGLNGMEGGFPPIDQRLYQAFTSSLDNNRQQNFPYPIRYPNEYPLSYPMGYSKVYPVACGKPYPYQMNLPMNYPVGLAENFQRLQQQMMKKESDNGNEKQN